MSCALCGDGATEGSDLCTACEQEQLPDLVPVAAGNATTAIAQPGWYVDPSDSTRQRNWNGRAWAPTNYPANSFTYSTVAHLAPVAVRGLSFPEAVKSVLIKYVGFSGRARRSEYWWFALFTNVVVLVVFGCAMFVDLITTSAEAGATTDATALATGGATLIGLVIAGLLLLAMALPHLAVSIRRLHDMNRSGWFYLINFVPFVGGIILLVVMCEDSTRGPNRYGPSPKYV